VKPIKSGLTAEAFLAANPPSDTPVIATWPYVLPFDPPFRCHNDLVLTRDHVRAYCAKRTPAEGCACLALKLRELAASPVRAVEQARITFTASST
jgi:hypothetical protein